MAKYKHICAQCEIEFEDYFENTKFCSRNCYDIYRQKNKKCKIIECQTCKNKFEQKYEKQIFCSNECKFKSYENKEQCICEYCNKPFFRKLSEVSKNKHHYCSDECRMKAMYWSDNDCDILKKILWKNQKLRISEKNLMDGKLSAK